MRLSNSSCRSRGGEEDHSEGEDKNTAWPFADVEFSNAPKLRRVSVRFIADAPMGFAGRRVRLLSPAGIRNKERKRKDPARPSAIDMAAALEVLIVLKIAGRGRESIKVAVGM